jgi:DNA-binding CsgD family transcriptional regulator
MRGYFLNCIKRLIKSQFNEVINVPTVIMDSNVFVKDDLCALGNEYALGMKSLKDRYENVKKSTDIHKINEKVLISSMKRDMHETKKEIDKYISTTMLRKLVKLDEEHERRTAAEFTKLLSESDKGTIIKLTNISTVEFKVLELYQESQDFNYIDEKLGWSTGASFKTYITLSYKIKRFFNKEFLNIYEDFLEDKSEYEAKTITRLHKFRKKCIEEDLFKPRDIKIPRIMDGKIIEIREEEIVTLLKLEGGESYVEIAEDLGWIRQYPLSYHKNVYKKFTEENKARKKREKKVNLKTELTSKETKVKELTKLGFTALEISNKIGITTAAVYDTKKRIKNKMKLIKLEYK